MILQAISHRCVTMDAQVSSQASPCGIYVGQSSNGIGFSHNTSFYMVSIIPPTVHTHSLIHSFIPVPYM